MNERFSYMQLTKKKREDGTEMGKERERVREN